MPMTAPILLALLALAAEPITPTQLEVSLQVPPRGAKSEALAARLRAAYPEGADLKAGTLAPLIEGDAVAFILEAPADSAARVTGRPSTTAEGSTSSPSALPASGPAWSRSPPTRNSPSPTRSAARRSAAGSSRCPTGRIPQNPRKSPERTYRKYEPLAFRSETFANCPHRLGLRPRLLRPGRLARLSADLPGRLRI